MRFNKEKEIFNSYLKEKNLKHSDQRIDILEVFLESGKHCTAEELCNLVKVDYPDIGQATVYRTLKLFCESGLCSELKIDGSNTRYEPVHGHEHHDHLVCTGCGRFVEVISPEMKGLQQKIADQEGFKLVKHKHVLYGLCKKCQ